MYEIEDGYKANLVEIVEKTLLLQLDEINFQPENDVNLHLEIGVGLDGAGMSNTASYRMSKMKNISEQCCQLYLILILKTIIGIIQCYQLSKNSEMSFG